MNQGDPAIARFKAWLEHCDKNHKQCHQRTHPQNLPSRLLNVSLSDDPNYVRLDNKEIVTSGQYIALSHCWGEPTDGRKPEWCTVMDNLDERRQGFSLEHPEGPQPKTLKDAIEVTRQLGVQYLWIDSLCIVQAGDEGQDWEKESDRMEAVFASAYCTIAASAAPNSETGFLKEKVTADDSPKFDYDLKKSPLNKRAWVLQERCLSRRTIHFCENQVYGECGHGIHTRNVLLQSKPDTQKNFEHDPDFPGRLRSSGLGPTMRFLQSLIEDYSGRGISKDTDRPIAIQGLMDRIANALPSKIYHGVIDLYLHRSLLWRRKDNQKTPKIFSDSRIPTWSWMAYPGGISFEADDCEWGDLDVIEDIKAVKGRFENDKPDIDALQALVWKFAYSDARMERRGDADVQVLDSKGLQGWISLDTEVELQSVPNLVVLARLKKSREDGSRYFVMFVQQQNQGDYERIGVGMIQKRCELASLGQHRIF